MKTNLYLPLLSFFVILFLFQAKVLAGNGQASKPAGKKKSTFNENKHWEQRLSEKLRSTNEVRMKSPLFGTNYQSDQIAFEWENGHSDKMFLGLMSNENKEVFYKEVSGSKKVIDTKEIALKPGLYYWVLESEDDILAVGKFYYKKK